MKKVFDVSGWARESHFNFFKDFDNPFYNICSNIEVTELVSFCQYKNISFFLASLFLSIKAANSIQEFKLRIEDDKVFIYNKIHPFSTVLNDDNTFSFCEFNYSDNFSDFLKHAKNSIEETNKNKVLLPKNYRKDVIHYTSIPWISLTSMTHASNYNTDNSIPKLVFGKYFSDDGKILMPICVEVHHSLVDGYHIGKYLEKYRTYIHDCDVFLIT